MPVTALNKAFDRNDTEAITNALQYHILKGVRKTTDMVPGVSYFPTSFMTDPDFTNVTGGQHVTNIKQTGDVIVFVSGLGSRSEIEQKVCS